MRAEYEAVVVGTGFGGSVSACRLAQAGIKVGVLERGRRYPLGGFPRDFDDPLKGWLWNHDQGLFDVKPVTEVFIVQSAAYGGGSHIYANVHLRLPPDGFAENWPEGYSRDKLDPYYDLVAYMLDIKPIQPVKYAGAQAPALPPKTLLMKNVAAKLGRADQFCYPNIAVNFGDPARPLEKNKFGGEQLGCNYCGECDIGCNRQAKNTLDLNYLAAAEATGNADVATQAEVTQIEPLAAGGYRVSYKDHTQEGQVASVEAKAVFVCAGAINTTELLLRCRDGVGTLPKLSPALGQHYSGNGDYLAFAFETKEKFEPAVGPTITTGIVYDRETDGERSWFIFEEGGYPRHIAPLLQAALDPLGGLERDLTLLTRADFERAVEASAKKTSLTPNSTAGDHSAVFLAMGRDRANGRIDFLPETKNLRIEWDVPSNMPLYSNEERFSQDVAKALGGQMKYNPLWKRFHQPVSVHNLGGCRMADHPADGVVDGDGQVYGYPGLFVMDGAALPAATGTNPSHTIAAVAERNIERFIRGYKGDAAWRAPDAANAKPLIDPLNLIKVPKGGTAPPETQAVGITFTETMKGFLAPATSVPAGIDEFVALANEAKALNDPAQFTLTITLPDLDAFLADKTHAGVARGDVQVTGLTRPTGARVTAGVFNLFTQTPDPDARRMLYSLPFYGTDGHRYLLAGYKDVRDHGTFDVWASTSTLYTVVHMGHDAQCPVVAAGVLHILKADFARQMLTFRTVGQGSAAARAEAVAKFGRLFIGTLFDVFVRPKLGL
jgi:cholesterol oxidase